MVMLLPVICDLLTPHEPEGCLRSSSRSRLMVPKSGLLNKGDRAFAVWAPKLGKLPAWRSQAGKLSILYESVLETPFYLMAFPN